MQKIYGIIDLNRLSNATIIQIGLELGIINSYDPDYEQLSVDMVINQLNLRTISLLSREDIFDIGVEE